MGRLYTVKKSILPESFYRFSVIQINIPEGLIYKFNEMFYSHSGKINWEEERTQLKTSNVNHAKLL